MTFEFVADKHTGIARDGICACGNADGDCEAYVRAQAKSPTMRLRWKRRPLEAPPAIKFDPDVDFGVVDTGAIQFMTAEEMERNRIEILPMNILQQCFCDADGNEEWRDVEIVE